MQPKRFRTFLEFSAGNRGRLAVSCAAAVLDVLFGYIPPFIIAVTLDNIINKEPLVSPGFAVSALAALGGAGYLAQNLWICALLLLCISAIRAVLMYARGYSGSKASENIACGLRNRLYDHLQRLPYEYHVKAETGDLIQRCTTDVDTVRMFYGSQLSEVLRSASMLLLAAVILGLINMKLMLISLIMIPLLVVSSFVFHKNMHSRFTQMEEAEGAMSTALQENLSGVRVVRAFGREAFERDKFELRINDLASKVMRMMNAFSLFWSLSDFVSILQQGIVAFAGAVMAINGEITLGTFLIFNTYIGMMIWPMRNFGRLLSSFGRTMIAVGRLNDILIEKQEDSGAHPVHADLTGPIVFEDVTFEYDGGLRVLDRVSFTIEPGQTVAILGATGSGKSTLVHLLQRLYDYQAGSITIGGVELKNIDKAYLRAHVGIVLQEPFLYSKTLRENIGITQRTVDDQSVYSAARTACLHDVIETFDLKYETVVGERGVTLSGGQKQRVSIARTLLKDNHILVFDDSLSAVDTETDAAIRAQLRRTAGITTIIISHRISTLSEADNILVMEHGRITQQGSHEQLIAQDGLYRQIWQIQNALEEETYDENGLSQGEVL